MKVLLQESGEQPERMTHKDAAMFPIIASGALFGLYIFFKVIHCSNSSLAAKSSSFELVLNLIPIYFSLVSD